MIVFGKILATLRGIAVILTMFLFLLFYAISRIFFSHTKESGLRLRKAWIKYMAFPILNLKEQVEGVPHNGPALYVSNHRSFIDPVVTSKYLDAFVIAKAEVGNYPILNKGAEATGVIYVKRENKDSRSSARKAFIDVIKSGHNILVYPEGTISTTRDSLPFKKGTFFEAHKENIPVVPIALDFRDYSDLWTIPNLLFQYLNQFSKWRTHAKMSFGPAMYAESGQELAHKCEEWINQEMKSMQDKWISYRHDEKGNPIRK